MRACAVPPLDAAFGHRAWAPAAAVARAARAVCRPNCRRSPAIFVDRMAPLHGKLLSPADRRVWRQAIAMLVGLKRRNGLSEADLAAAVGTAVRRGAARRYCEDCGEKVTGGAIR